MSSSPNDPRIRYAASVLLEQSLDDFSWPGWLVYDARWPEGFGKGVQIVPSGFFGDLYGGPGSLPTPPLAAVDGTPLLFGRPDVQRKDDRMVVHADLLASAYFLTTRYEEWVRREVRDPDGRFPGRQSLPARAGFIERPVVDEYGQLLRRWAADVGINLPASQRRFSVLLTHDVDKLGFGFSPRRCLGQLRTAIFGGQPRWVTLGRAACAAGLVRHPCNNLKAVRRLDRRLTGRFPADRCQSWFFFMSGGTTPLDGEYAIRGPIARRALRDVIAGGGGIGLHASYEAGLRPELIASERTELEQVSGVPVIANRHHYLALREPEDARALPGAGIAWDSTMGYADVAGFRLGVCRPIPLFDPIACRPLDLIERPLVLMDCTLDRETFMNLGEEAAFEHTRKLIDATYRHRGEFVCLWHNTVLAFNEPSYHKRLYRRILKYLGTLLAAGD